TNLAKILLWVNSSSSFLNVSRLVARRRALLMTSHQSRQAILYSPSEFESHIAACPSGFSACIPSNHHSVLTSVKIPTNSRHAESHTRLQFSKRACNPPCFGVP